MSWTAQRTWVTAEVVTSAFYNTYLKADMDYLKGEADVLDTATFSQVSASRALATAYQNSNGTKTMVATVSVSHSGSAVLLNIIAKAESANPPTKQVGIREVNPCAATSHTLEVTFLVPPLYYYEVTSTNGSIAFWTEHLLH